MTNCGCHPTATTIAERKILIIALILNASMFVIGLIAGVLAESTSLVADSLDMLADAAAYTIALYAIGRSQYFKRMAAALSGGLLLVLGISLLIEVIRRAWLGSSPESTIMIAVACISLIVNVNVLRLLKGFQKGEVHLRATWLFTRADIIVNLGVVFSGVLVALTKSRYPDLVVGLFIGLYVIKEAFEILRESREI